METPTYRFSFDDKEAVLTIGFTSVAGSNDQICKDIVELCVEHKDLVMGVPLLRISGPVSMPGAFVIAHSFAHLVNAIAVFDPKLGKYVVCISHSPDYKVGDLVE
jgi:CRISPR-associated protein Csx3